MKRHSSLILALLATAGCVTEMETELTSEAALTAAPETAWFPGLSLTWAEQERSEATATGWVDGFLAFTDDDAVYLAPNQPLVEGKDAIADLLEAGDPDRASTLTFSPRRIEMAADGLYGYSFGWSEQLIPGPDGSVTVQYGKYMTVWQRKGFFWLAVVHLQNQTGFTPSPAPDFYPLLDPELPVLRPAPRARTRNQIIATDLAFAALSVAEGSAIAFPAYADDDAVEVAGPMIYGRDAIAENHAQDPLDVVIDWAPVSAGASFSGDLGHTVGLATYSYTDENGQPAVFYNKYLTFWERQPGGAWRWTADSGNPAPQPPQ